MSDSLVPICTHIKINGSQCQVAALRGRELCHFHDEAEKRRRTSARIARRLANRARRAINIPVLEDANAIQLALMETMHALIDQRLDQKEAALLFYGLQTASANVKSLNLSSKDPNQTHKAWLMSQRDRLDAELAEYDYWQKKESWHLRRELEEEVREEIEAAQKRKAELAEFNERMEASQRIFSERLNGRSKTVDAPPQSQSEDMGSSV